MLKYNLNITTITTVKRINALHVEKYEAEPTSPRGWTKLNTNRNVIGYIDILEKLCLMSTNKNSKFLFRANGPDLYYARIRVVREVCKNCRNKAYEKRSHGTWTESNNSLVAAWYPKGLINPIRPKYGNMATVYCPGPVVDEWVNDYLVPKIYSILIDHNKLAFTVTELEMLFAGDKYHHATREYRKVEEAGYSINSEQYKKTFNKQYDAAVCNRVGIKVNSTNHATREVILPPPIWCPYKEEHGKI